MDQRGDEVHTSSTEATGASREDVVRWVLVIGTFLAIALLTIIWITGAFSQDEDDVHQNVGREIQASQADAADEQAQPMMPAIDDGATSTATASAPAPSAPATPGDAPAGDPRTNAQ